MRLAWFVESGWQFWMFFIHKFVRGGLVVYVECLLRRERGLRDRDAVLPNQREIHTFVIRNSFLKKIQKAVLHLVWRSL